jgi:cardiolipin synthase
VIDFPTVVTTARQELGLPALGPSEGHVQAPATSLQLPPPDPDDPFRRAIRSLGSKPRAAAQALADAAAGATAAGDRQVAANALLSALYVDAVRYGEPNMPRAPRVTGNRVDLLVRNEQFLPRLYEDLAAARSSITVNQFNWEPDGSGERVVELLERKAREGVDVRVLVDGSGFKERGDDVADAMERRLEAAGVRFERTGGFRLRGSGFEHRKLYTIDDRVAYTGGLGLGAKYDSWTDLMVRMEGPVAAVAAASALASHTQHQGEVDPSLRRRVLPIYDTLKTAALGTGTLAATAPRSGPLADGRAAVTLLDNRPSEDLAATEAFLRDAAAATDRFWATSTYLTTDVAADALIDAARRGVDVRLLVSSLEAGNDRPYLLLGRPRYRDMVAAGVKIYEYPTILHAKSWLRDDDVAAVGSMNLSRSSMARSRELSARVEDPGFAQAYARFHEEARERARLVTPDQLGGVVESAARVLKRLGLEF